MFLHDRLARPSDEHHAAGVKRFFALRFFGRPGPLTLLRNMRAFRVFRLFKRIESLRKILEALARARTAASSSLGSARP